MPAGTRQTWGGSLHQTFRLLPQPSANLRPFLEGDGLTPEVVLARLPYDQARSRNPGSIGPDPKRYRDGKQVYQTAGLVYEGLDGNVHVTDLGRAVLRWLDILTTKNVVVLGRHAAYALAACQLRNPTGAGVSYDPAIKVFPFAFIWKAMLTLDGKISSDELNRAIFKVRDESELEESIRSIREARAAGDPNVMGPETLPGPGRNDRIIPWMSIASFGWTLISDKRAGDASAFYEIPQHTAGLLAEAAGVRHRHREFGSVQEYVEHVSRAAALPNDLR